jgi:L-alanine-DL-glutamate epimerase-like enolase superfamily enzyme
VAVGALDMPVWDAAAKIAGLPLHRFLGGLSPGPRPAALDVPVYVGGGYYYPGDDVSQLADEIDRLLDRGYTHVKIKIGGAPIARDVERIEAALKRLPADRLAVAAMNAYDAQTILAAVSALAPFGLWWFEDVCDPLDFEAQAAVAARSPSAIAAGEALFSVAEAKLLDRHGGLRPERDILLFDPAHCYGIPGYLQIIEALDARGWPRRAFCRMAATYSRST